MPFYSFQIYLFPGSILSFFTTSPLYTVNIGSKTITKTTVKLVIHKIFKGSNTYPPIENGSDVNRLSSTFRVVKLLRRPEM